MLLVFLFSKHIGFGCSLTSLILPCNRINCWTICAILRFAPAHINIRLTEHRYLSSGQIEFIWQFVRIQCIKPSLRTICHISPSRMYVSYSVCSFFLLCCCCREWGMIWEMLCLPPSSHIYQRLSHLLRSLPLLSWTVSTPNSNSIHLALAIKVRSKRLTL